MTRTDRAHEYLDETEHNAITSHNPLGCFTCDTYAHETEDGTGCWCPVCICPNVEGGNDSSDGVNCGCILYGGGIVETPLRSGRCPPGLAAKC